MKNILWFLKILIGVAMMLGSTAMIIASICLLAEGAGEEWWAYVLLIILFGGAWFFGLQLARGKIVWKKKAEEEYIVQEAPMAPENAARNSGTPGEQPVQPSEPTQPKPQTSGAIPIIRAWKYECRDAVYREYRLRRIIAPVAIPAIYALLLVATIIAMIGPGDSNTLGAMMVLVVFTLLPLVMIPFTRPNEPLGMHLYFLTGDYRLWLLDLKQDDVQYFLFQEYGLTPQYYKHINHRRWVKLLVREWKYMKQLQYIEENGLLDQWLTTGQAVNLADPLSVQKLRESGSQLNVTLRALNEYTGKIRKVNVVFRRKHYSDFDGLLSTLRNAENKEGF